SSAASELYKRQIRAGRGICQSPASIAGSVPGGGFANPSRALRDPCRAGDLPIPREHCGIRAGRGICQSPASIAGSVSGGGFANPPRALWVSVPGGDLPIPREHCGNLFYSVEQFFKLFEQKQFGKLFYR
ncbi:hypothetical protein QUF72_07500, partial [Desulfobacterales bacterium HSG2]|nr:hypothetical protein [Desulfobacterales bacterium HSG2]